WRSRLHPPQRLDLDDDRELPPLSAIASPPGRSILEKYRPNTRLPDSMTPVPITPIHLLAAAGAAFLARAINSVAGGGTMVSFPTLIWLGLPTITANATSTLAIWPGSLGSIWGFRSEFGHVNPRLKMLSISSLIGGAIGALLLRSTPPGVFQRLVPFLLLFATILFMADGPIRKMLQQRSGGSGTNIGMPVAVG